MQARMPQGEELDAVTFYKMLYAKMDQLGMSRQFTSRAVNEGFSGGEKKRNEVLQMLLLDPLYAILDETDSGLDIDALRIVSEGVNSIPQLPGDHPLQTPAGLHQAGRGPRAGRRTNCPHRGRRTGGRTGKQGI